MFISHGKPINSERLKQDIDKANSIDAASRFSKSIPPGEMISNCPICASGHGKEIAKIYGFQYVECDDCGTAYVANPPSEEALSAAYRSDYYTASNRALLANDSIIDYRVENVAKPKVKFVVDHLTTKKRSWLDIGCGAGENLGVAKALGFETLGLETNGMERDFAQRKFGITVNSEFVSTKTVDKFAGRFGVVSLFGVLEHLHSPTALLSDISRIQDEGDNLAIEVPHYPSISAISQFSFPSHVNRIAHPPLHLYLFPLPALDRMLVANKYEITAVWMYGQDFYEVFSTLGMFAPGLNGSVLHQRLAPLFNDLQQVIDNHELSDELLVVARKLS